MGIFFLCCNQNMRRWKTHIVNRERSGPKRYVDRRRFNRWNSMMQGGGIPDEECTQLKAQLQKEVTIIQQMTAGSMGCVFQIRGKDGTMYIKKIMDAHDYSAFQNVRNMFHAANLHFGHYHPAIRKEGIIGRHHFIDMEMGEKVNIVDDKVIVDRLRELHHRGIFHGDIFMPDTDISSTSEDVVYILNHTNVTKTKDGIIQFIDFGNQYQHENPLQFEQEQLQRFENGIYNIRYQRRLSTARKKRKRMKDREHLSPIRGKKLFMGGACTIKKKSNRLCVRQCTPVSLKAFAQHMRANKSETTFTVDNYTLWRQVAEKANTIARRLGAAVPDMALPPDWEKGVIELFEPFALQDRESKDLPAEILMADVPEGNAGIYEPFSRQTLDTAYPTTYHEEYEPVVQEKDASSPWCSIYFRQHLVAAKYNGDTITIYNPADDRFLPLYMDTWVTLANQYFKTNVPCDIYHLDMQMYNDCSIWTQMIPLYEKEIIHHLEGKSNQSDADIGHALFHTFLKHF